MFKISFLILVVMSSFVFAQTNENSSSDKTSNAKVFSEFGVVPNGQLRSENRILLLRGNAKDFQQTQIWLVPADAEMPKPLINGV